MPTTITLTGFKEFEDKLKRMPKILSDEIDGEVEDAGRLWADLAKKDAPKDQDFLIEHISSKKKEVTTAEVFSNAEYSAYVEWGTRKKVRVPGELQAYASQFMGRGSGGGAKEMIFAWMKRVGIPKERQYAVFFSIMVKGINPHPFFFIQTPLVQRQLDTNVQRILNTEH